MGGRILCLSHFESFTEVVMPTSDSLRSAFDSTPAESFQALAWEEPLRYCQVHPVQSVQSAPLPNVAGVNLVPNRVPAVELCALFILSVCSTWSTRPRQLRWHVCAQDP